MYCIHGYMIILFSVVPISLPMLYFKVSKLIPKHSYTAMFLIIVLKQLTELSEKDVVAVSQEGGLRLKGSRSDRQRN